MKPRILLATVLLSLVALVRAVPPNDAVVTFNEIQYNPAGTGEDGEWIELFNQMAVNVDISGWKLTDGVEFKFPDGTIVPGGGRIVVAKSPASIQNSLGPFSGALDNSGERLRLEDNNGRVMDQLTYGDKGDWPVAPDGSGASLAKRDPYSGSALPGSWTASAQAGGTPGAPNFPPPPPPSTTRVVARSSTWKYLNNGSAPSTDWKQLGFDDSAWSSGAGGFSYGPAQVYMDPVVSTAGGIWSSLKWTGDGDSGISSSKTYTHKIGLNRSGAYSAINGVTFDSPGSGVKSGANWSLTGADTVFAGNAPNLPAGTGSRQMCEEFFYGATGAGGTSRLQLSGLTAGEGYVATFYVTAYGGTGGRIMQITPSDSNAPFVVDQNLADTGNGMLVKYHYKAPSSGVISFDFYPLGTNATWHHYAFSNELAPVPSPEVSLTDVGVADFSSQLTSGFTRGAINCVNGSGLSLGRHGTVPDGAMWLSNGTFAAPNDPLPATITFDLQSAVTLSSFHVWNYNESGSLPGSTSFAQRGANSVEVLTASSLAGPFVSAGIFTFFRANGTVTEAGQNIELNVPNTRFVRFNIVSNHGGDNSFAGLSEVKFFRTGSATATPVPYRERISTLFNTGINAGGGLATPGTPDAHYINVANGQAPLVQNGHPAWLANDADSQWTGFTASGTDNVPPGQFTWRTTFDLSGYDLASVDVKLYPAADNSLDDVLLNGVSKGISGAGFAGYLGPYTVSGFSAGNNTVDLVWTNFTSGVADPNNPGGFRAKWVATGQPDVSQTTLTSNPVTTYFRHVFNNPGSAQSVYRLLLEYAIDDGAVFYLNGQEIHRKGITGVPTPTTLADGEVEYPRFSGQIQVPPDALVVGENVLAVELHQASAANVDALFLATLDVNETPTSQSVTLPIRFNEIAGVAAGSFFVELRNTGGVPASLAGYTIYGSGGQTYTFGSGISLASGALLVVDETTLGFKPLDGDKLFIANPGASVADAVVIKNNPQARDDSGRWLRPNLSTPGTANSFVLNTNAIVLNEIMYHHHPTFLPTGVTDNPEEWLELFNRSGGPVNLTGWGIRGGVSYDFPAGQTIPAGGFLVVSNNPAALLAKFPGITVVGPFSGGLSNSDDVVRIEDANGNLVNEVHYFGGGRWDQRADGGGGSLELRNPDADNTVPESWAASDETGRSAWQTFTYTGQATPYSGSNDPTNYNEFVMGLLNDGEYLIDDISVKEVSVGNRECIQNGTFTAGNADTWRNLGTHGSHGRTVVVDDPSSPGNKVLKVVATGATEHMHNHCETTLRSSGSYVTIVSSNTYAISFRARWLSGCPRLNTRLYFNRLARQHLLPIPNNNGTPGAQNSRYVANLGPTLSELSHSPVLPDPNLSVTVRVRASDPQSVSGVALKWRADGSGVFNTVPMLLNSGFWEGVIPGQAAGGLVQFYVEGTDGAGGVSALPSTGASSRALIRWKDGIAPTTPGHGMRLLMLTSDADFLHSATNVMSNDPIPCTLVYRESEVFYNIGVHLKSSERGRLADTRVGFTFEFDPTHLFRGVHRSVNVDRSSYGRGTTSNGFGMSDIINWQYFNRAGGIPSMFNDVIYLIAPRSQHNGSGQLVMSEFNDPWLDSQFSNGASYPVFKYELIYYPTTTTGGPEGLKIPQPDDVRGVEFESLNTTDKEAFRWNLLIGNARTNDDYSAILKLNQTFRMSGAAFNSALPGTIDVDEWLRCAAALSLAGINDSYITNTNAHNIKFYHRPDGRLLMLPWDVDFQTMASNAALISQPDITRITGASVANQRLFYQHLQDIIATSFNTAYLTQWVSHYQLFNTSGGDWNSILTYVTERANYVTNQINALYPQVPFSISTNDFSTAGANATVAGVGWINVRTIVVEGDGISLPVTWTGSNTWQTTIAIHPGVNNITLKAYNYQGALVGTDSIVITGTGTTVPAAAGNLVISELNYHPAPPSQSEITAGFTDADDFEFIELQNIGSASVNLAGCQLTNGVSYSLPSVSLAPGAYAVIARRATAFAQRYPGVSPIGEYYQQNANLLDNGGENVVLVSAGGADIVRFSYGDGVKWPAAADGLGRTLVLIAPKTNPNPDNPLHWRASAADGGNPGSSDAVALPSNLTGDDDGDGLSNLLDHALGAGTLPRTGTESSTGAPRITYTLERNPLADANWEIEVTSGLTPAVWTTASASYEIISRTILPGGTERLVLRSVAPGVDNSGFFRSHISAKP